MELALRIFGINYVIAFWSPVVAFNPLRANRYSAERDFISLEDFVAIQQGHSPGGFHDYDLIRLNHRAGHHGVAQPDSQHEQIAQTLASTIHVLAPE
jgi:hypothetical protein